MASTAIEEIAHAIEGPAPGPSLVGGAAGRAVFFTYLDDAWPGRNFRRIADRHLDQAIDQLSSEPLTASLFGGFAGVAWAVEHLNTRSPGEVHDPNFEVDEALLESLRMSPWVGHFDLVVGLAGYGVYALERAHCSIGRACLAEIVRRLDELAEARCPGLTWPSRPEFLSPESRAAHPHGYDNLGVAHGAPAVALILAGACAAGVEGERARSLLDGAVEWILAQGRAEGPSAFPSWIDERSPWTPARSAWCYGDPGIAVSLLATARILDERRWEMRAVQVARRAALRELRNSGVRDAGLCHGAAGLMLLYHRLWNATGDELFADAARRWLERTLEFREPGRGIGGFRSFGPPRDRPFAGQAEWRDDASLLTGSLGIGLALLSAIAPREPAWDRILAMSLAGPV